MDEAEGLEILIQQRTRRQRLMRMISRGRPADDAKQHDIVDERPSIDDDVSTGDEEYFSAEEGSEISDDDVEEIESDSEEEPINLSERKKPSKRKRKRLKELLKSLNDDDEDAKTETFSLVDFFSMDYRSRLPTESDLETGVTSCVNRQVPSLVALCLECCQNTELMRENLPPGIRRLMSVFRYEESLRHLQIDWSYRCLGQLERCLHLAPCREKLEKDGICSQICWVRDLKHVAMEVGWGWRRNFNQNVPSKVNIFPVVWPIILQGKYAQVNYAQTSQIPHNHDDLYASTGLEVMSNMIDLMLPVTVRSRKWQKKNYDDDENLATSIRKIRQTLQKRHPKYTGYMFDLALGYAFWVRGDLAYAEQAFRKHLSRKGADSIYGNEYHKSLVRNEVGRMFMMFGDLVKASQYYLEAVSGGKTHEEEEDPLQKEAFSQALTLIATQTDTGLLTASKAQESAAAWSALFQRKDSFIDNIGSLAAESAVRIYGGHIIDHRLTSKWHRDVLERLHRLSMFSSTAQLAMSLVHAMLGEEVESKELYTNYISAAGVMFYEPEKTEYQSKYLLSAVLDQVKDHPRPIQPIKLLWRTQLCYPSFSYQKDECHYHSKPTDDCSAPLNLRLSEEGYLTGDMVMCIPPIRSINLDPYTGGLCLPHVPLRTNPWKDLTIHQPVHLELGTHRETFRAPRILRVMDNDVCIVDFCIAADVNGCQSASLTWIGSDGMRMTLDLKKMIRMKVKKEMELSLETNHEKEGNEWVNERLDIVNVFWERGLMMSYAQIKTFVDHLKRKKKWEADRKERDHQAKQNKRTSKLGPKPTIQLQNFNLLFDVFYTFGQTVILQFKPDASCTYKDHSPLLVVVNCRSIDTFKAARIYSNILQLAPDFKWSNKSLVTTSPLLPQEGHTQTSHFPHAEIFIIGSNQNKASCMSLFDADGNHTTNPTWINDHRMYYIIGRHYYSIRQNGEDTGIQKMDWDYSDKSEAEFRSVAAVSAVHQVEDIFIIEMALGICLMNPLSMEFFTLNKCIDSLHYSLESESTIIMGENLKVTTFTSRRMKSGTRHQGEVVQIALGLKELVLLLEVPFDGMSCQYADHVDIVLQVAVPGVPREICLISYEAGFIVAASLEEDLDAETDFRNHLYQFSPDGRLMGILPFLGKGPHRFTPIYLEESEEHHQLGEEAGDAGWHVFFVDGHGALACFNASATQW